jgi:hypothetical protein
MACNTDCSSLGGYSFDTTSFTLYANSLACSNSVSGIPCSNTKSFSGDDLTGCGICDICGGGTPYFTTNGSGVRTCYTGAGCGTPCAGVPEPLAFLPESYTPTETKRAGFSLPSILLSSLVLGMTFFLFFRKVHNSVVSSRR